MLLLATLLMADTSVVLKKSVQPKGALQLGQIAVVESDNPRIARYLSSIQVPAALYDDGVITQKEIKQLLAGNLIDPKHIRFVGSAVAVHAHAKLTKERLEDAIRSYIQNHYKDVRIKRIYVEVPKGITGYRLHIAPSSQSFSHIYLNITIDADNERLARRASVQIERYAKVPVAVRDIPRGALIHPEDITYQKKRITNASQLRSMPQSIVGSVARSPIHSGAVIKPYMVTPDYAVKKHKNVKILYQKGAIRIELLGLALDNGNIGDTVRVKNLSSNKVLQCKVLQSGVVQYR